MVEVYYFIPAKQLNNAVGCGIKLSEWYDKEVEIAGDRKKCISALLNPRDDPKKYMSADFRCVKIEIMQKYCYIADGLLYQAGLNNPEIMDIYTNSVIPVENYTFGQYRLPECLVTCTVIGNFVSVLDNRLDSPILFNNSEELYMNNVIERLKETHDDFNDVLLYFFFSNLANIGKARKMEDAGNGLSVFVNERDGKVYTIKIPDLGKY